MPSPTRQPSVEAIGHGGRIRNRHEQRPIHFDHAPDLIERRRQILEVLQAVIRNDQIEASLRKGQFRRVSLHEIRRHPRRTLQVRANYPKRALRFEAPLAAPQVQHHRARWQIPQQLVHHAMLSLTIPGGKPPFVPFRSPIEKYRQPHENKQNAAFPAPMPRHPHATLIVEMELTTVQINVIHALAAGATLSDAAEANHIQRITIYRWMKNIPQFADALRRGRAEFVLARRDDLQYLSNRALETLVAIINNPRASPAVLLRASMFILQRPQLPKVGWNMPEPAPNPDGEVLMDSAIIEKDYNDLPGVSGIEREEEPQEDPAAAESPAESTDPEPQPAEEFSGVAKSMDQSGEECNEMLHETAVFDVANVASDPHPAGAAAHRSLTQKVTGYLRLWSSRIASASTRQTPEARSSWINGFAAPAPSLQTVRSL